jgi:hypothetical protein
MRDLCHERRAFIEKGKKMTKDIYYDRSLKLWVLIIRDEQGNAIKGDDGYEATYYRTKAQAIKVGA